MRKGVGFILCLLILTGGCGDSGSGSSSGMEIFSAPCGTSAPGQTKFKSRDRLSILESVVSPDLWVFPWIQKGFKEGFQSVQQSLRDQMKALGLVGEAMAQGVSAMVSGSLSYEDREYDNQGFTGGRSSKPIRYMQVELVRESDGVVLGSGTTDLNGDYEISFSNTGTKGVYVRVLSQTGSSSQINLEVRNNLTQKTFYAVRSMSLDEMMLPASVDFQASVASGAGGAFNILDVLTDASELIRSVNQGTAPPLMVSYWEKGSSDGTCYNSALESIFLLGGDSGGGGDTDEYDDDIILHEYGHFLAEKFSRDDSPGGSHSFKDIGQDTRLAWSEGWSHFISGAVRKNSLQVDTLGGDPPGNNVKYYFDIEPPSIPEAFYTTNEVSIASILWDLFDDPNDMTFSGVQNESFDALALGLSPIWEVMTQSLPNASLATLGSFWEGWLALGLNIQTETENIFSFRFVEFVQDDFENDGFVSSIRKIIIGATEHHTLYPFGDVDIVAFDAVAGETYTIKTSNLTDGADTVFDILDSNLSFAGINDNQNGQQYPFNCGLECPVNNASNLSSSFSFLAIETGVHFVRISRSLNSPASSGRFGSYNLRITSP